jgi:DNA-binding response OmpR family regulator
VTDESTSNSIVLAVFPAREDCLALGEILAGSGWRLRASTTLADACRLLHRSSIGSVISECCFPDGRGWKDLLAVVQDMINPPPLIVADRLADERLWAEVLNLGGHDLLAKPFEAKEVLYAVSAACRWRDNQRRMAARRKSKPAGRSSAPAAETYAALGGCG